MSETGPEIKLESVEFSCVEKEAGELDSMGQKQNLTVHVVKFSTSCFSRKPHENTDMFVVIEDKGQSASALLKDSRCRLSTLFKSLAQKLDDDGWWQRE